MGCGNANASNPKRVIQATSKDNKFTYTVNVIVEGKTIDFTYKSELQSLLLTNLMNFLSFAVNSDKSIDGNFVTIRNFAEDKSEYFVQRLVGIEIEDEKSPISGKLWVVYINNAKMMWNDACTHEVKVKPTDSIQWHYQHFSDNVNGSEFVTSRT